MRRDTVQYDTINLDAFGDSILLLEYLDGVSALVSYAYVSLSLYLSISLSHPLLTSPLILSHIIRYPRISSLSIILAQL